MYDSKISVCMATYNGQKYLSQQIDSIINQSYKNLEIIICDDNSTDNTLQLLEKYAQTDSRIRVVKNSSNLGYVKNFEKAIGLSTGEYIALSDQDDIWEEDKLEVLLSLIKDNLLIHSDCALIDENNNLIQPSWKGRLTTHKKYQDFLFSNVVTGCSVLFSKDLKEKILPFPDELIYHDWYVAIIAAKYNKIEYTEQTLFQYRQHANQDTGAFIRRNFFSRVTNVIKRLISQETNKEMIMKKQLQNLEALQSISQKSSIFTQEELYDIENAIVYHKDYLEHFIHLKMFIIGCKYKTFRSKYNKFCIMNILREVIG